MRCLLLSTSLALGFALSGCASNPPLATSGAYEPVPLDGLPAPTADGAFARLRSYVIGPFDELSITVWGLEGLSDRKVQADASGTLSFPIAGSIRAAGLTPAELERTIAERLRARYVRDPQVSVNVVEAKSQTVTIDGQVGRPGIYPIQPEMSLLKSIASAQGTSEYAREEVVVFREVSGRKYAAIYNLEGIRAGNYGDPAIYGGDVVVVGDSPARRRLDLLLSAGPALLSPLILLVR